MGLAKNSDRRETLLQVVRTVTGLFAYSRSSSTEGLKFIKFFNNPKRSCRDVRLPKINGLFKNLEYDGLTRIGTSLKEKVLSEYKNKYAEKPLIVLIVTDGEVCTAHGSVLVGFLFWNLNLRMFLFNRSRERIQAS